MRNADRRYSVTSPAPKPLPNQQSTINNRKSNRFTRIP
jgi:hypothetical protein